MEPPSIGHFWLSQFVHCREAVHCTMIPTCKQSCNFSLHYAFVSCANIQASYGVEDAEFAVVQLAQTTMRSELGKAIKYSKVHISFRC